MPPRGLWEHKKFLEDKAPTKNFLGSTYRPFTHKAGGGFDKGKGEAYFDPSPVLDKLQDVRDDYAGRGQTYNVHKSGRKRNVVREVMGATLGDLNEYKRLRGFDRESSAAGSDNEREWDEEGFGEETQCAGATCVQSFSYNEQDMLLKVVFVVGAVKKPSNIVYYDNVPRVVYRELLHTAKMKGTVGTEFWDLVRIHGMREQSSKYPFRYGSGGTTYTPRPREAPTGGDREYGFDIDRKIGSAEKERKRFEDREKYGDPKVAVARFDKERRDRAMEKIAHDPALFAEYTSLPREQRKAFLESHMEGPKRLN